MRVGTPPKYSGDADLYGCMGVIDRSATSFERRVVIVRRALSRSGNGRGRCGPDRCARDRRDVGYRQCRSFLAGRTRARDFMESP